MSNSPISALERFKAENLSACVIGYTGGTGSVLVQELERLKIFKRVVLIGRREVPLPVGDEFEQKIVDFERLEDFKDAFQDIDVGFYLLGTTREKAGREGFIRVDRDYCLKVAEIAKQQNCKHFLLMSSVYASSRASSLYLRIKGEVEEAVTSMNFEQLSIFRPAYLLGKRNERRFADMSEIIVRPIAFFCPTVLSVPMQTVAKAMITCAITPASENSKVQIYENRAVHHLAKDCPS